MSVNEGLLQLFDKDVLLKLNPYLKDSSREGTHKLVDAIYDNPDSDVAVQCATILASLIGRRIEGYDATFSPDEVRDNILKVYRDYCVFLYSYHQDDEREIIKKLHNDLFQDCINGGVLSANDWEMIV